MLDAYTTASNAFSSCSCSTCLPPEPETASSGLIIKECGWVCREGNSVFFTGCAGTGKSLLLKHMLRTLPKDTTFVTASTGLAASALGGTTINAFAGLLCHCFDHDWPITQDNSS